MQSRAGVSVGDPDLKVRAGQAGTITQNSLCILKEKAYFE
jgi:hypothetical protein